MDNELILRLCLGSFVNFPFPLEEYTGTPISHKARRSTLSHWSVDNRIVIDKFFFRVQVRIKVRYCQPRKSQVSEAAA